MTVSKSAFERLRDLLFRLDGRPLVLILLLIPLGWRGLDADPWPSLRRGWFDLIQAAAPRPVTPQDLPVRIVAINDPSLETFGQWPWPRSTLARLIDRIQDAGGLVLGLDMLFDQPDRLSPERFAGTRPDLDPEIARRLSALPANDAVLAASLQKIPTALGLAGVAGLGGDPLRRLTPIAIEGPDPRRWLARYNGMVGGYERLHAAAAGHGVLNQALDRDGVVRRAPLLVRVGDRILPSLSVEMLRLFAETDSVTIETDRLGVTGVRLGQGADAIHLPAEPDGTLFLRHGPTSALRYVSARDVMEQDAAAAQLNGKLVLIGFTASGFVDVIATPTAARMNGVEVHAQIIENALAQDMIRRAPFAAMIEGGMIAVGGGVIALAVPAAGASLSLLILLALLALSAGLSLGVYQTPGWLLDSAYPMAAIMAAWAAMTLITLSREALARRQAQRQLEAERLRAAKIEGELEAARAIQMGILPHVFPAFPTRTEFDLHAFIEPARHVGGDLYDFALIGRDHLFFMIGDVSGKGLPAALFMALTKALTRSGAERTQALGEAAATTAIDANAEITRENAGNLFVTAIIGFLDLSTGDLSWVNAGHDPPYLLRPGAPPKPLDAGGGPPLCAVDEFPYDVERLRLAPGDSLLFYTDGVAEAADPTQALYGLARLEELLTRVGGENPKTLIEAVRADVASFVRGADASDDLTLLALRWIGGKT